MNTYHLISKTTIAISALIVSVAACSKKDHNNDNNMQSGNDFHVAMAMGSDNQSQTYVQGVADLSKGEISFLNFGFNVPSTRTARFYASSDGKYIYNLDYGGGKIYKYKYEGGQKYTQIATTDVQNVMGTPHPRWTKISEEYALMHNVTTEKIYDGNVYKRTASIIILALISLNDLSIVGNTQFEMPMDEAEASQGYHVFRIDAPVIQDGKAYYGLGKRKYNPTTDASTTEYINASTLVIDFPSLANPKVITTTKSKGGTNGYRTPVAHIDNNGDIYQLITVPDKTYQTHILRIKNGTYDESYSFNLSALVGENTISNGWFYVGNGIGYVPYVKSDMGGLSTYNWGVARVDLYNNTAVKLNLPNNLWLQQYQYSVARDGKFYMALSPVGGEGNIYIFDVNSNSPDAFTKGAKIKTGNDAYYIGIF